MNFLELYQSHEPEIEKSNDLQRTDEWFANREGRFTGSEIHKLMGTSSATSKMEWGTHEKLIDFNDKALKYIFGKAKERQRHKVIRQNIGINGTYGSEQEETIFRLLQEKFKKAIIKKVGFIEFIEGVAGASPDGTIEGKELLNLEIKCATGWDGLYLRHEKPFDQSHQDFWQIQSEMMALKVKKTMYVVAEPSEDIFEPNITDLSIKYVVASPIHQEAIYKRCIIGDDIIKLFLSGIEFHDAVCKILSR